jgi:hypothetical protein
LAEISKIFFSETNELTEPKLLKNSNLVKDIPMIITGQFGFNCPSGFREEAF